MAWSRYSSKDYARLFPSGICKKVAVILDCFEIFIERPSGLQAHASIWSNYKHHNTAKVLLDIAPQGVIKVLGRPGEYKHRILNKLTPGDIVLHVADRGFDIADCVGIQQCQLYTSALTRGKSQLSTLEVHETWTIANVRIHVEQVIGNVKRKYSVLKSTIPVHFTTKRELPVIDYIVSVCCALSNMCTLLSLLTDWFVLCSFYSFFLCLHSDNFLQSGQYHVPEGAVVISRHSKWNHWMMHWGLSHQSSHLHLVLYNSNSMNH